MYTKYIYETHTYWCAF